MCDRDSFIVVDVKKVVAGDLSIEQAIRVADLSSHGVCQTAHRLLGNVDMAEVEWDAYGAGEPAQIGRKYIHARYQDSDLEAEIADKIAERWPTLQAFRDWLWYEHGGVIETPDGTWRFNKEWQLHTGTNQPSLAQVQSHNGGSAVLAWHKNGRLHRDGGPAYVAVGPSGVMEIWYQNGEKHREDGPAQTEPGYTPRWYLEGRWISDSPEGLAEALAEWREKKARQAQHQAATT